MLFLRNGLIHQLNGLIQPAYPERQTQLLKLGIAQVVKHTLPGHHGHLVIQGRPVMTSPLNAEQNEITKLWIKGAHNIH